MKPVARYGGELIDFRVGNGGAGLGLYGGHASPDVMMPGEVRFVFVRPTVMSDSDDLAKR